MRKILLTGFLVLVLVLLPVALSYSVSSDSVAFMQDARGSKSSGGFLSSIISSVAKAVTNVVTAIAKIISPPPAPKPAPAPPAPVYTAPTTTTPAPSTPPKTSTPSPPSTPAPSTPSVPSTSTPPKSSNGGGTGGGGGNGGSGGSGGSIIPPITPPVPAPAQPPSLSSKVLNFFGLNAPFDQNKGVKAPPTSSTTKDAALIGVSTVCAAGAACALAKKPAQEPAKKGDLISGFLDWGSGAISGAQKAATIYVNDQKAYLDNLGSKLSNGDLLGAAQVFVNKQVSDAQFVVEAVQKHWVEIAVGVAIGAALVVAAPVLIPAAAVALGVSAATMTTAVVATAAVATVAYVGVTYGNALNDVNSKCNNVSAPDAACRGSMTDMGQQVVKDTAILGGSIVGGGALSKPFGTWAARQIPVSGLTDPAAVETYNVATEAMGRNGAYGQYSKVIVSDSSKMGESRAATNKLQQLWLNKDKYLPLKAYPDTAILHEDGHNAVVTGLSKTTPEIAAKTLMGTEDGGMIIEVAADKNAYMLGGQKYAQEWQSFRKEGIVEPFLNEPYFSTPLQADQMAYVCTVYQNTGDAATARSILSAVAANNDPSAVGYFNQQLGTYQQAWDSTSISRIPSNAGAAGGLVGGNVNATE